MGVDMAIMVFTLPVGARADWKAAAREIRGIPLERLWDRNDLGDLYPWEDWLSETPNLPGARAAFVAQRAAQNCLREQACLLRTAIEMDPCPMVEFSVPGHKGWIVGGLTAGDAPDDLQGPLIALAEAGILRAAGFSHWTVYGDEQATRSFDLSPEEERRTRIGIVGAHVAERAALLPGFRERRPVNASAVSSTR